MAILIQDGADPLSEAALRSLNPIPVLNAQSEAGRVLLQELSRYCAGAINGRSFLIAGHRGAGKTTMVSDAIDRALRVSLTAPDSGISRPLPVFLHGPSLFETIQTEEGAAATKGPELAMAEQARAALTQIILGLHRVVAREIASAYALRLADARRFQEAGPSTRREYAEVAAQLELELAGDPTPVRLREFWALADALDDGVLFSTGRASGQGARELVALSGLCEAYRRISGELRSQRMESDELKEERKTATGLTLSGSELVKPVTSVLSGLAVAGGVASQSNSVASGLLAGVLAAIGSSFMFSSSRSRAEAKNRKTDTTFIPDLSLKTLDRVLPMLLQRLRDAGMAPVLIIDELDKVDDLSKRLEAMIHYLKKLLAENVFTCFLTDRGYMEQLRLEGSRAYGRSYSYFSHPLLVNFQPADLHAYLEKLLRIDEDKRDADLVDIAVLPWMLRFRAGLHALTLAREISLLRGGDSRLTLGPGVVRTDPSCQIAITFQVAIELQLAQPHVAAWMRLRPERGQTLLDALYFPSRRWANGEEAFEWSADSRTTLIEHLVKRMNLEAAQEKLALSKVQSGSADEVLPPDDVSLFMSLLGDMLGLLNQDGTEDLVIKRWDSLKAQANESWVAPPQVVTAAMLLGDKASLLEGRSNKSGTAVMYRWRYRPSGILRAEVRLSQEAVKKQASTDEHSTSAAAMAMPTVERIEAAELVLQSVLQVGGSADAEGSVFGLLADQLKVLPTSPAWPPVKAAINNIKLANNFKSSASTLVEDIATIDRFDAMLSESLRGLFGAFTLAACLAGTFYDPSKRNLGLRQALRVVSDGMGFDELNPQGLVIATDLMQRDLEHLVAAPRTHFSLDGAARIEDLPKAVELAFKNGNALWMGIQKEFPNYDRATRAWESARVRIEKRFQSSKSSRAEASAAELLGAVAGVGPAVTLGYDFARTPLSAWSTLLISHLTAIPEIVARTGSVPDWAVYVALQALGASRISRNGQAKILQLLAKDVDATSMSRMLDFVRRKVNKDGRDRFALCLTDSGESPMHAWRESPSLGFVLVISYELGRRIFVSTLSALDMSVVVALDGEFQGDIAERKEAWTSLRPHVWVYPAGRSKMELPAIVSSSVDDVLKLATSPDKESKPSGTSLPQRPTSS